MFSSLLNFNLTFCKKFNKPQLQRVRRPEWGALMLYSAGRDQQEWPLFFPGKDSARWKTMDSSPPNIFSLSIKLFSFPCQVGNAYGSSQFQTLKCNVQVIPNKLLFPGEIPVSLFISGQLLFSSFINVLHPYYTIIFLTLHIGFLVVHKTFFFSNIRI